MKPLASTSSRTRSIAFVAVSIAIIAVSAWITNFADDILSDEGRISLGNNLMHHSFTQSMITFMGGNYYQESDLIADFKWWVADDEHKHLDTPKTGDTARIILWVSVAAAAVVLLAVLLPVWFKKRRQEMKR